jgi:predicted NUDIX family phosphoesterase
MPKEALGVPKQALIDAKILPPDRETAEKDTYIKLTGLKDLYRFIHFTERSKEARVRGGESYDVENDTSFQQIVMVGVVLKHNKVLAYQRGSDAYDESRLAGKMSIGIGGHFEPSDSTLIQSMYREFAEEVTITQDGIPVPLEKDSSGKISGKAVKEFISMSPVGIIKDERDDVGKVHLGLVCVVRPRQDNIDIAINTDAGENVSSSYVEPQELSQSASTGKIMLEGWGDIVLRNELLPSANQN